MYLISTDDIKYKHISISCYKDKSMIETHYTSTLCMILNLAKPF